MNVKQLYECLDTAIPSSLSCKWDNDGLMCCPDEEHEVKKVLLSLDVTAKAIEYAVKNKFDVIVSHHPLVFSPLKSVNSARLINLIKNGISVMSFHTRFDKLEGGVNTALADIIGIKNTDFFCEEGIGLIGELDEEISFEQFAFNVKAKLGCGFLEAISTNRSCKKIAVVGGDGKDFLLDAVKSGCDTYLTGSMSYNSLTDAIENKINIIAAGHFYTENPSLENMKQIISKIDNSIECCVFFCNEVKVI